MYVMVMSYIQTAHVLDYFMNKFRDSMNYPKMQQLKEAINRVSNHPPTQARDISSLLSSENDVRGKIRII